jgi:predicted nuclease of predicted toxin-antitoxin system
MHALVDNNLPITLVKRIRVDIPDFAIDHIYDLGLASCSDSAIRRRFADEEIIWITRDEDFWLDCPARWSVVWLALHNPTLAFLRDSVAPALVKRLPSIRPGQRVLITEDSIADI